MLRASPAIVRGESTVAANPPRTVCSSHGFPPSGAVCSACPLDALAGLCVDPLPQQPTSGRFCTTLPHRPHICPLDESQGGFRWSADCLVGSLVSAFSSRSSSHTFVAFIDVQKAFDTSWVEGTLVRLFDADVSSCSPSRDSNPKSTLAPLSPPLGPTLVSLRGGFCHPFCSTFP